MDHNALDPLPVQAAEVRLVARHERFASAEDCRREHGLVLERRIARSCRCHAHVGEDGRELGVPLDGLGEEVTVRFLEDEGVRPVNRQTFRLDICTFLTLQ